MRKYTLALLFDQTKTQILLMKKSKPEWQKGKLNGIGGKIEADETPLACIVREIQEETSIKLDPTTLTFIGNIGDHDWTMAVFTQIYQGSTADAQSLEAEPIAWFSIDALPKHTLANLRWMIPYALEFLDEGRLEPFSIIQRSHTRE